MQPLGMDKVQLVSLKILFTQKKSKFAINLLISPRKIHKNKSILGCNRQLLPALWEKTYNIKHTDKTKEMPCRNLVVL